MADCPYLDKYNCGCIKTGYFCIKLREPMDEDLPEDYWNYCPYFEEVDFDG